MFDIRPVFSRVGNCDLVCAAVKASSWNGLGCARYFVRPLQLLVRVDYTRAGMARGAVACEAPAGKAISVGFRRNCIQCTNVAVSCE